MDLCALCWTTEQLWCVITYSGCMLAAISDPFLKLTDGRWKEALCGCLLCFSDGADDFLQSSLLRKVSSSWIATTKLKRNRQVGDLVDFYVSLWVFNGAFRAVRSQPAVKVCFRDAVKSCRIPLPMFCFIYWNSSLKQMRPSNILLLQRLFFRGCLMREKEIHQMRLVDLHKSCRTDG